MDKASAPLFQCPRPTGRGSDQYDVFLSFRGLDTRTNFTDHLYCNLVNAGTIPIRVFRDRDSIPTGEKFDLKIFEAITQSKISIPIISEKYATSKWCLRELIHMMNLKKSSSHIVLPIFYKVKPSDVRCSDGKFGDGKFGEAFRSCIETGKFDEKDIQEGQQALRDVSYIQSWESEKIAGGHEGELVKIVLKEVLSRLRHHIHPDVSKDLIGIDNHLNKIRNWVDTPVDNAQMIGIYGMGGIGKTTLAKAICNKLSNEFVHCSYLLNIRDKAILSLQNQLIKDILPNEREVPTVDHGISLIKSRFNGIKVLILLDDIEDIYQLNALAREHNWFMAGSMIIVTTRYEDILNKSKFKVVYKYPLNEMDEEQSLLLFNKHAFRRDPFPRDFEDISRRIISTMGGLPLALEVVGASLYDETDPNVWNDVLEKVKKEPHRKVQMVLKISYDALEDKYKKIFLDIACFFIGKKSQFPIYMWKDCGYHPSLGIKELKLRCLIKIGDQGEFRMHDLLRDFGRNIVYQEGRPEKRSRLWAYKEASEVLMRKKGTEMIEAMCLDDNYGHLQTYTNEQFHNLRSLRFLQLRRVALSGNFNGLFSELKWLRWFDIEPNLSFSATNLHLLELVVLQLSHNEITEHWRGWSSIMVAKKLKVLDLACCNYLRCTPNLSVFTELEILILKKCDSLEEVHHSIGEVKSLIYIDMSDCGNLKVLPEEVGRLDKLKVLILDSSGIKKLPTSIGSLRRLEKLTARDCRYLREFPGSLGDLSLLRHLSLWGCYVLQSLPKLPSGLTYMSVSGQSLGLPQLSCLINLEELFLYECNQLDYISELSQLKHLKRLHAKKCHSLVEIQGHVNLEEMVIDCCDSIDRLILPELGCLKQLKANSCNNLVEIQGLDRTEFLEVLVISNCGFIKRLPDLSCFKSLKEFNMTGCKSLKKLPNLSKFENLENFTMRHSLGVKEIPGIEESRSLTHIDITGCESMEVLPNLSGCERLQSLVVQNCKKLTELWGLEKLDLIYLDIFGCDSLEEIPDLPKTRVIRNHARA